MTVARSLRRLAVLPLAALLAAAGLAGCDKAPPAKANKNPRVLVNKPITDTVIDYQDFTGRLDAFNTVEIKAHVSGYVVEAPFKEGDYVKKNQLLFQIDPRPFQADLNQADANLKVAIAERNLQEKGIARFKAAQDQGQAVGGLEIETATATFEKARANVGAMEAAKARSQLYLDYTRVLSPVSGRVSRRFIDPGNLINADMTLLTTVVDESQVYAYFDVDERTFLELLTFVGAGNATQIEHLKLPVAMRLANETEYQRVGVVDFVDNRVVATTGTVRMRGLFQNSGGLLKSGLFIRIRLPVGKPYPALLIPDEAVQSDQERKYVWVVNAKNEVEYRSVRLGQSLGGLRVILPPEKGQEGKEGLSPEDRVVVSGMQKVRNGVTAEADLQSPPPPPKMSLVRLLAAREQKTEDRGQRAKDRRQKTEKDDGAEPARK
ncbi:MAG: efflux RND transporter periplasmic adaptor subunit [Gemmataceae bacterium]